jgi:DNA-directed RNA polymerase sigma subunit (sigma70/sigma32)
MEEEKKPYESQRYMTQEEVAIELNLTRSKVDLIERNALRKLKYKVLKKYKKEDLL